MSECPHKEHFKCMSCILDCDYYYHYIHVGEWLTKEEMRLIRLGGSDEDLVRPISGLYSRTGKPGIVPLLDRPIDNSSNDEKERGSK